MSKGNFIAADADTIYISGDDNIVSHLCEKIALINSSGCTIEAGVQNVALINSSGLTIEESNVMFYRNARIKSLPDIPIAFDGDKILKSSGSTGIIESNWKEDATTKALIPVEDGLDIGQPALGLETVKFSNNKILLSSTGDSFYTDFVGFGVDNPTHLVQIEGNPVLFAVRKSSDTSVPRTSGSFAHRTSGNMVNGFAVQSQWFIEDATSGLKNAGNIIFIRDGADNTTKAILQVYSAGSAVNSLTLLSDNTATLPTGRIQTGVHSNIATTDASSTEIDKIDTLIDDATNHILIHVSCKSDDDARYGTWIQQLTVSKNSGTPVIRKLLTITHHSSAQLKTNDVSYTVNGGDIDIDVTGIAATNIQWDSRYEIVVNSTN